MVIGIFGGSFNPIHIGHAILANYISQFSSLDEVWMMVTPANPLKSNGYATTDENRIAMVNMVTSKLPKVKTSTFEFSLPRPSYTIDTLNALSLQYPNNKFKLIIGADNWSIFNKWKDSLSIINKYGIIIYPRKGYEINSESLPNNVDYLDSAPLIEVSSTFIRECVSKNINVEYYLPEEVNKYILSNSLYK